ncbi:hypothetical protein BDW66DRAFT_112212 [Aspergillus desertorum]
MDRVWSLALASPMPNVTAAAHGGLGSSRSLKPMDQSMVNPGQASALFGTGDRSLKITSHDPTSSHYSHMDFQLGAARMDDFAVKDKLFAGFRLHTQSPGACRPSGSISSMVD